MDYLVKLDKELFNELDKYIYNELKEIEEKVKHDYYGSEDIIALFNRYAILTMATKHFKESREMYDPIKLYNEFKEDNKYE